MRFRCRWRRGRFGRILRRLPAIAAHNRALSDLHFFQGPGYVGLDASTTFDDATIRARGEQLIGNLLHRSEIHPDAWQPAIIRDPADTEKRLQEVAGAKYSYHDLDNYTDLMQRTLQGVPETSKVQRSGVLPEQIYLDYSQQRLAQYGYDPSKLKDVLGAQNITLPAARWKLVPKTSTSILRDCSRMRRQSATSSLEFRRRTARCICATWWTSRAATRARQRI